MGTGKTPISLGLAEVNSCTKILIITLNNKAIEKNNLKGSWLWWCSKSNIEYNQHNKDYLKNDEVILSDTNDVLLLNYESLYERNCDKINKSKKLKKEAVILKNKLLEFIESSKNHNVALIIDESHSIKNLESLRNKAINKIKKLFELKCKACFTYLLTGTPFTRGYEDLYAQLKILGCPMNKTSFIDNFCIRGNIKGLLNWQQPIIGYKNETELYKLIHKYAITIKSESVVDLPEKIFVEHVLEESMDFKFESRELMKGKEIDKLLRARKILDFDENRYNTNTLVNNPFYRNLDYPSEKYLAKKKGTFWLRCRQVSIGFQGNEEAAIWYDRSRLDALEEFLKENKDNYLLFYNFMPELIEIYDICEKLGYNIDVFAGDNKLKSLVFYEKYSKQSNEEKLNNKNNIILANFASGSTAMNWQEYNKCIIFSLPTYSSWAQGLKRIHRVGQKNTCFYHIFYQNNFLDKGMKKTLDEGTEYTEDMFDDDLKRVNVIMDKRK